jgi:hypothetical protein
MLNHHRPVVVLGSVRTRQLAAVRAATSAVGAPVVVCEKEDARPEGLPVAPLAIVAPNEDGGAFARCAEVRSDSRFAGVPIIVIAQARDSLSFGELFQSGGDDLVRPGDDVALARRLRAVSTVASRAEGAAPWASATRHAVMAGPPSRWQGMAARALSNAGIPTGFASTSAELAEASRGAKVVVAVAELGPHGARAAHVEARRAGSVTPWVIVAEPRDVAELTAAVEGLGPVAVIDSFAPPENALFVANELAASTATDNRSTTRLLYGTAVGFREAGREGDDDVAFTYNVSVGGLFARTLAPLAPREEVWLELWAPRSSRRVRLVGTVAWRRPFGPNESATVPAGFGIQITGGLGGDLDLWREGCAQLERAQRRVRTPDVVPMTPAPIRASVSPATA